jgi:hypothetical protein
MTQTGRRARLGAVAVALALLGYGTAFGSDDHFPFGPFSMFSRRVGNDGIVRVALLRGRMEGGVDERLGIAEFGLRRAEIEGQIGELQRDPRLMAALADAWDAHNPGKPRLVEIRLIHLVHELEDGKPVSSEERVLATWTRS